MSLKDARLVSLRDKIENPPQEDVKVKSKVTEKESKEEKGRVKRQLGKKYK